MVISGKNLERRKSLTFRKISSISSSLNALPSTKTLKPFNLLFSLENSTQLMNHPSSASISWKVLAEPRLPRRKVASAASVKRSFQVPFSTQLPGTSPP
eukprot:Skav235322  [mRNA]  locus=scaffold520:535708:545730:- [translate_table: standard]